LLKQVGTGPVIETIRKAGITTPLADNLSLGLGSSEVNPLEMASAYGVFANGGLRVEPIPFTRVAEENGRILEEKKPEAHRVFDERSVALLNQVLSGVVERGTGKGARLGRPAAGKTGTTDNSRDAWFVGYTPQYVAALWVGNDQNTPMRGATGGSVCAPAWGSLMREVVKNTPAQPFPVPAPAKSPTLKPSVSPTPSASPTNPVELEDPSELYTEPGTSSL
ncbi:MAG: transglycosylase domain-containing protein, partial [Bacteroidota bacterium]